jgi:hypothetical protein
MIQLAQTKKQKALREARILESNDLKIAYVAVAKQQLVLSEFAGMLKIRILSSIGVFLFFHPLVLCVVLINI